MTHSKSAQLFIPELVSVLTE